MRSSHVLIPGLYLDFALYERSGGPCAGWETGDWSRLLAAIRSHADGCLGQAFRDGGALLIRPPGSPERYVTFLPTLRRLGDGKYRLGEGQEVAVATDEDALEIARTWWQEMREREIQAWLGRGGDTADVAVDMGLRKAVEAVAENGYTVEGGCVLLRLGARRFAYTGERACYILEDVEPAVAVAAFMAGDLPGSPQVVGGEEGEIGENAKSKAEPSMVSKVEPSMVSEVEPFQRGPYGEILPPPLVFGTTPEDALREMVTDDIYRQMRPAERRAFYGEALLYTHQQNLMRVLAGAMAGDPDADALYRAVMQGERLSLSPVGLEEKEFETFVPVLQRIGDDRWQVGIPDDGRHVVLTGDGPAVIRQAWLLYVTWAEAEMADRERTGG